MIEKDPWPFAIRNGSRDEPRIAITVDDCFEPETVQLIYDLCVSYGVCVTFFPLGNQLRKKNAEMWQTIAASPYCEIGSHTQNHTSWKNIHNNTIRIHMRRMQESLDEVLGYHYQMNAVRPPYGHYTNMDGNSTVISKICEEYGFSHVVLWDISQTDAKKAIKQVQNGSILLYHARKKDYKCLQTLIPKLIEAGYEMVTVSDLLSFGPIATSTDIPDL